MTILEHCLVVDDDNAFAQSLTRALENRGFSVATANDAANTLKAARQRIPDRVVLDMKIGNETGLQLIQPLLDINPAVQILMLTGYSSIATAVTAIKLGAVNYLCKPARVDEILAAFSAPSEQAIPNESESAPSPKRLEWEHIQQVLLEHKGNISAAARTMGMHRRTLQRKLQKKPVSR